MHGCDSSAHQVREVWTSDDGTMAKETARKRWPKIVQGMIDDVAETTMETRNAAVQDEADTIKSALKEIKEEMLQNKFLR
jgi:hypothetical protein